ncbi:MAG TPA: SDR family NAD(P)-dependent oxidoreductase [Xanthobacteraceae bacterium]|nr:SDR family NAD(P)-dependent oxidoreductase [Xanthobacteraceae bacterium]
MPQRIIITGASSGIGKALALRYAREGASLGLLGRHKERLESIAKECRALGAEVATAAIDIRHRAELMDWINDFDRVVPVDLVIANAGVMEGTPPGGQIEPPDAAYALMETNVLGLLNTVQPLLPVMMARGGGQIALISSIAGFVPLPDSPSYSASKAAVLSYGLSLRDLLLPHGVGVCVICPGYIATPMMQRESGPKPFVMTAEKAAELIARGIERNKPMVVIPRFFGTVTRISGLLPERVRRWSSKSFRFTVGDPQ